MNKIAASVAIGSTLLAIVLIAATPTVRGTLIPRDCAAINFKTTNPFLIQGLQSGDLTQYVLRITPGRHVSYLLISDMDPAFQEMSLPALIRSDDAAIYTTAPSSDGRLSVQTRSAYTLLSEETLSVRQHAVRFPVNARNLMISQAYGSSGPITHLDSLGLEHAVDISGDMGAPVLAAKTGVVVYSESRSPDGACTQPEQRNRPDNQIVVLHDDGTEAVYGHLRQGSLRVDVGRRVEAGEQIAEMGSSGWTPGTHLHFHIGGLTPSGYRTLPLIFLCSDGSSVVPVEGGPVCRPRA